VHPGPRGVLAGLLASLTLVAPPAVGQPFLIGRDGRAVARAIGPREWAGPEARALIESLLMEPTGRR
jgi:hypothetical protein